jgi:phage terminase large subunit
MFQASVLYEANLNATEDVLVNQGGSSSGKTYSILQVLFTHAIKSKNVITVVGEDVPNLKAGALRDAKEIYDNSPVLQTHVRFYNSTERIFFFKNGSIMEFKGFASSQDAKSGKRDYLFINEANGISYEIYNELEIRTSKQVFIDYNPNAEFWVHEKVIPDPTSKLFISDHRHNPFVKDKIRQKLEALKDKDLELWKVYARGLTGKIEGLIFRNWTKVPDLPRDKDGNVIAEFLAHWLDWGFTNDPTSFGSVYRYNSELYLDEQIYESNLTNSDIIAKLKSLNIGKQEIVADSAEPKSIEDLNRAGFRVVGAKKGPDSVIKSIDLLKPVKLNITQRSVNTIKEFGTYKWKIDKNGNAINEPVDFNDHSIAGIRYVALNKLRGPSGKYYFG